MSTGKRTLQDGLFTLAILAAVFILNLILVDLFDTKTLTPMIFVLGVFLVSWRTQGYLWGIIASLLSVLSVNLAFTYPYWEFDLISPECISSAVVMLIVSTMMGALTTRLKRQEQLKAEAEKERMRGDLLRAVSHDLRTPLTSICGACSAIIEGYDQIPRDRQLALLGDIRADSQWLARMVENLLSVTRADGERIRLTKQSTVLEELIDAVLVKFRKHYPQHKVCVDLPEAFVTIPMDPVLIGQVLMNLLENAVLHAHGMEHLWLRVTVEGNKALFSVADDGCGIPRDRLPHLFTGLLEADAPADPSRSNMGIGLSVCRTIVKAHGADLEAADRAGGGAVFRFALTIEEISYVEQ